MGSKTDDFVVKIFEAGKAKHAYQCRNFLLGLLIKNRKKLKLMTIDCVPELPRESPSRTGSNPR